MPSKPKTPALDRLVRREWRHADEWPDETMAVVYKRKQLRELIQSVAREFARIAMEKARRIHEHSPTGAPAVEFVVMDVTEREFGLKEGKDGK